MDEELKSKLFDECLLAVLFIFIVVFSVIEYTNNGNPRPLYAGLTIIITVLVVRILHYYSMREPKDDIK